MKKLTFEWKFHRGEVTHYVLFYFRPQYGGMPCQGDDKVYKMCNVNVSMFITFSSTPLKDGNKK